MLELQQEFLGYMVVLLLVLLCLRDLWKQERKATEQERDQMEYQLLEKSQHLFQVLAAREQADKEQQESIRALREELNQFCQEETLHRKELELRGAQLKEALLQLQLQLLHTEGRAIGRCTYD